MIKEFLLKKKIERSIRISLKNNDKLKKLEDEIFCQVMSIDTDIKFIYQFINKNFSSEPKENPFFGLLFCTSVITSQINILALKFSMPTKLLIGCTKHFQQKI